MKGQKNMNKTNNFKKFIAIFTLITMISVLFMSTKIIVHNSNHHCNDSQNCPICQMIEMAESSIRTISSGIIVSVCAIVLVFYKVLTNVFKKAFVLNNSLITQKVRLND